MNRVLVLSVFLFLSTVQAAPLHTIGISNLSSSELVNLASSLKVEKDQCEIQDLESIADRARFLYEKKSLTLDNRFLIMDKVTKQRVGCRKQKLLFRR